MTVALRLRPGAYLSNARLRDLATSLGPRVGIGEIGYRSDALAERVATPRHRTMLLGLPGGLTAFARHSLRRRRTLACDLQPNLSRARVVYLPMAIYKETA